MYCYSWWRYRIPSVGSEGWSRLLAGLEASIPRGDLLDETLRVSGVGKSSRRPLGVLTGIGVVAVKT